MDRPAPAPARATAAYRPAAEHWRVSRPDDPAERDADRRADQVMRSSSSVIAPVSTSATPASLSSGGGQIHRACGAGGACSQCADDNDHEAMAGPDADVHRSASVPASPSTATATATPSATPSVTPSVAAHVAALRGSGRPLPAAAAAFFEPRFDFDFGNVRVHTDARAEDSARQLQARAFTVGSDIVFGSGEYNPRSSAGMRLLAHELAHVVQQPAGVSRLIRRATAGEMAEAPPAPDAPPPQGLIVDDEAEPAAGQMRKSEFLPALRGAVQQAVEAKFTSPLARASILPMIEDAFASAQEQRAGDIEQKLHQQVSETAAARTAADYLSIVSARVSQGGDGSQAGVPAGAAAGVARKARGAAVPAAVAAPVVQAQLGHGSPIDGGIRARMESGFGMDFSQVRVHTDPRAVKLAERLEASAFTVGNHVAFGHGAYRPGTTAGDLLLAHELAHVAQQRGSGVQFGAGTDQALERDADASAETVIGRLWNGVKRRWSGANHSGPKLKSGVRLQRKHVNFRLQNSSGFDVCIFCVCASDPEAPEKLTIHPREFGGTCPAGLDVDSSRGCVGHDIASRVALPSDPCPESTHRCL
jgi:hypothetical protein